MARIDFSRGVPPLEAIPRADLEDCFRSVLQTDLTSLQYGTLPLFRGHPRLRAWIAQRYSCSEEEVLCSNGSLQILDFVAGSLTAPDSTVLTEQPCYDRAARILTRYGARVLGIELADDGIDLDALEEAVVRYKPKLLYIVPDFQNPAGTTCSAHKRRAVVELADRANMWVVEDTPYRELRYQGAEPRLMRDEGSHRVLTLGSFSKTISPGVRVGFLLAPREVIGQVARRAEDTYLSPVVVTQAAIAEYLDRGLLPGNIDRLRVLYRPRWEAMRRALNAAPIECSLLPCQGGYFVGVFFAEQLRLDDLVARAREQEDLVLTPGLPFFVTSASGRPSRGSCFLRLAFQQANPVEIEDGVARLLKVLSSYQ